MAWFARMGRDRQCQLVVIEAEAFGSAAFNEWQALEGLDGRAREDWSFDVAR